MSLQSSLPIELEPSINNLKPNVDIPILKGILIVTSENINLECTINIKFTWFPRRGVEFFIEDSRVKVFELFSKFMDQPNSLQFKINNTRIGQLLCRRIWNKDNQYFISGLINPPFLFFFEIQSFPRIQSVKFHIFNFKGVLGDLVRNRKQSKISRSRLRFPMDDYEIIIDSMVSDNNKEYELKNEGGYGLSHVGELSSTKNEYLKENNIDEILNHFSLFLSFLDGRRLHALFRTGIFQKQNIWIDFSNYNQATYSYLPSWLPQQFNDKIASLWKNFYSLCTNKYDSDSMYLIVHWYLSANKGDGGLEGSIILLQNAYELMFRWLVIEKKQLISSKESEKLRASDKIRDLLKLINCDTVIPYHYQLYFQEIISKNDSLKDFPFMFTEIRNSFVHSNRKKREKINALPNDYLSIILNLGIFYVELLILYLLDYDGNVASRISESKWRGSDEIVVPWISNKIL